MTCDESKLHDLRAALPELPFDGDGPVFRAPWEAQAFAMTLALHERGIFTWKEWAHALSVAISDAQASGDPDHGDTYYAHWLSALERLSAEKGCVSATLLARRRVEWDEAARSTPHGEPIVLGRKRALPEATLDAYRAAIYRIDATPRIDMKIGAANAAVVSLLLQHDVESAVFVTAFNPFGHVLAPEDNAARQRSLIERVGEMGLRALPGEGVDPMNIWSAETSLFVLGATPGTADALMTGFGQNAVVYVDRAGVPELLLHPDYR
ncbi:Nitrile hydratase beta subunit [Caballeronia cordobensis]|uniref:Nitrile hydratase beta subunit n=1 Tax=Caballeronia cordobensis TaxID=1353886 RepID=A0A158HSD0_CABCO|nr:nitrile hydratase accessory protein [Caballeronia cordobensis]SAL47285.1 Nitrile hydratase beta subunit [Caballeronia cordobensis]